MEAKTRIHTRIIRVNPASLKLLELNARYMRHEVFARLVENIQRDGGLTGNTPFAWLLHDDKTQQPVEPRVYEVLSGNHRAKASIAAGMEEIDIAVTDDYLPPDRRRAIQLSHNSLTGEDDPAILKLIYESIEDTDLKLYSGLDDKLLGLLDDVSVSALSEAGLEFQTIGVTFLPHEREALEDGWTRARKLLAGAKGYWVARWGEYDRLLDALEATQQAYGVKNTATSMMIVLDVFWQHIEDLQAGYLDDEQQPIDPKRHVPVASVLGLTCRADLAAKFKRLGKDPMAEIEALIDERLGVERKGAKKKADK